MLIYVDQVTERLQCTLEFIFTEHGLPYRCTNDKEEFISGAAPKLNYSDWDLGSGSHFKPSGLLFEDAVRTDLLPEKSTWNNVPMLRIDGAEDPFSAIFYVLSRYEEYTNKRRDKHGRFEAASSIQHHFGWLQTQIVEQWTEAIILRFAPQLMGRLAAGRTVEVIPTFDIDNTFAYKWKGGWRKYLAILKDYSKNNKARLEERKQVNSGISADPFDTFAQIENVALHFPQTRIFWHLGDYGTYDRNLPWHDPRHQRLIRNMSLVAKVGLHPSYNSNLSDKALADEQKRLQTILGTPVTSSRQHFLKLQLPQTYRRLIALGFRKDFTMGYADQPGFRAGTARPFCFFDLEKNEQTTYRLVPFAYMDGTFREYLDLSIAESKAVVSQLVQEVNRYGGNFCFIWHNETIGEAPKWKGWSELLDYTLTLFSDEHTA